MSTNVDKVNSVKNINLKYYKTCTTVLDYQSRCRRPMSHSVELWPNIGDIYNCIHNIQCVKYELGWHWILCILTKLRRIVLPNVYNLPVCPNQTNTVVHWDKSWEFEPRHGQPCNYFGEQLNLGLVLRIVWRQVMWIYVTSCLGYTSCLT